MKISAFMISIVIVGLFIGGFAIYLNQGAVNYNITDYDNSSINSYNRIEDINLQAEELRNRSVSIKTESGILDVIGGYFKSAYTAVVITQGSYDVSVDLVQEGTSSAKIGTYKDLIVGALLTALTLAFFLALLAVIFKVVV